MDTSERVKQHIASWKLNLIVLALITLTIIPATLGMSYTYWQDLGVRTANFRGGLYFMWGLVAILGYAVYRLWRGYKLLLQFPEKIGKDVVDFESYGITPQQVQDYIHTQPKVIYGSILGTIGLLAIMITTRIFTLEMIQNVFDINIGFLAVVRIWILLFSPTVIAKALLSLKYRIYGDSRYTLTDNARLSIDISRPFMIASEEFCPSYFAGPQAVRKATSELIVWLALFSLAIYSIL